MSERDMRNLVDFIYCQYAQRFRMFLSDDYLKSLHSNLDAYKKKFGNFKSNNRYKIELDELLPTIYDAIEVMKCIRPRPGIPHWGNSDFFNASMHLISSISIFERLHDELYKEMYHIYARDILGMICEHYDEAFNNEKVCAQLIGYLFNETNYNKYTKFGDIKQSIIVGNQLKNFIKTPWSAILLTEHIMDMLNVGNLIGINRYNNAMELKNAVREYGSIYSIAIACGYISGFDYIDVNNYMRGAIIYFIAKPRIFSSNEIKTKCLLDYYFRANENKIYPRKDRLSDGSLKFDSMYNLYYVPNDYRIFIIKSKNNIDKLYYYYDSGKYLCYFPVHQIIMDFDNDKYINRVCNFKSYYESNIHKPRIENDAVYAWFPVDNISTINGTDSDIIAIPQIILYSRV